MTLSSPRPALRWSTVSALYACLTIAYCWPLLLSFASALPNDTGDPGLLTYLLWWNARAVPYTERWWNVPMFYPQPGVLAFSDTLLGMTPFSSPLIWAGVPPVAAFNTLFVASVFTAALSAHGLARHLTGRHDAAILAGLAFGFSPYRASQMPHLQLLITCWMPLGLLALHRYLRNRRRVDLVWLGLCWMLNGLTNGYYLVFFAVLVGCWMLWFARAWRDWMAIAITFAIASLPILPIVLGHAEIQGALGMARSREEIESFSADLTAFLAASWHAKLPYLWSLEPYPEGELYPGAAIVVLTVAGAIAGWRHMRGAVRGRWALWAIGLTAFVLAWLSWMHDGLRLEVGNVVLLSARRPGRIVVAGLLCLIVAERIDRRLAEVWRHRSPFAFYALAAVLMAVLALGPVVHVFREPIFDGAPYAWLMALPGGDSLRVPARFAMLMVLCLSQTAALAFARFTPGRVSWRVVALAGVLIAADGWVPNMLVSRVPPPIQLPSLDPRTLVLEFPARDIWADTAAMLRATAHGHRLINGFSGYGAPHYDVLLHGLAGHDPSVFQALRRFGPLAVIVERGEDPDGVNEAFTANAEGARFLYRTRVGPVYVFPQLPPAARSNEDVALPVARITADPNPDQAAAMLDGDLTTQWKSGAPQAPGQQIVVTLTGERRISGLEMDLEAARLDYPRELRIEARTADGRMSTIWHAGTAGPAMLGALADSRRQPVRIDLPVPVTARELVLTLTGSHPELFWTVAELHVYGASADVADGGPSRP